MSAYIAFDLDALNVARDVGNACGLDEAHVTHGLLRMWSWCFRSKTDLVESDHIKGFFGVDACGALTAFGFLSPAGEAFRVRGADRYLRISEARRLGGLNSRKNLKQFAPKKPVSRRASRASAPGAAGLKAEVQPGLSSGSTPALTPNTEHRTPNTSLKPRADSKNESSPVSEKPTQLALSDKLIAEFKSATGKPYRFLEADGVQLAKLRKTEADEEILRRWRIGLRSEGFYLTESIAQLAAKWNSLATEKGPKGKPRRADITQTDPGVWTDEGFQKELLEVERRINATGLQTTKDDGVSP